MPVSVTPAGPLRILLLLLLLAALYTTSINAFLVVPSSRCAAQCGNVLTATSGPDLTCSDSGYASTVNGQTFQSCIACELNSTYMDPMTGQTDLQWLLYNLRYSLSWCLWGYPNNTSVQDSPCTTSFACGPLLPNVEYASLATNSSTFDYCPGWGFDFTDGCTACLRQTGNINYLANFVVALTAGCRQRPAPGSHISLDGSLFQPTLVNITVPVNSSAPAYTPAPTGPLTLGAKVGIVVGGLILICFLLGVFVICRGKRRRRAHLEKLAHRSYRGADAPAWKEYPSPESETGGAFMVPDHQRWQGGNDGSPMSAQADHQVFSPYVSQHVSPVSPVNGDRSFPPIPIPPPYDPQSRRQSKTDLRRAERETSESGESIEMPQIRRANSGSVGSTAPVIREPTMHLRQPSQASTYASNHTLNLEPGAPSMGQAI